MASRPDQDRGRRRGRLFVISGPSGVGKGTVVARLRELVPDLVYSVSATTRPPRPGEVHGVHYLFVSPEEFDRLVHEDAFLEWAVLYGRHRSGTLRDPVRAALGTGRDIVLEIDVQGARAVRSAMPDAVLVFLAPPSDHELVRRLGARRTETDEDLARRLAAAAAEGRESAWFDHVVVNDDVERAAQEVAAIIQGRA